MQHSILSSAYLVLTVQYVDSKKVASERFHYHHHHSSSSSSSSINTISAKHLDQIIQQQYEA